MRLHTLLRPLCPEYSVGRVPEFTDETTGFSRRTATLCNTHCMLTDICEVLYSFSRRWSFWYVTFDTLKDKANFSLAFASRSSSRPSRLPISGRHYIILQPLLLPPSRSLLDVSPR